jgi:hypothetical protein
MSGKILPGVCHHCDETLRDIERHPMMRGYHYECAVRIVIGSVAHIERRCSCFVDGSEDDDPPGLSKRDAARMAHAAFRRGQLN